MGLPSYTFEVAWSTDPYSTAPVWVDETARVRSWSLSQRRGEGFGAFEALNFQAVLWNAAPGFERRYEAENTASPLFPNVLPRKRWRLRNQAGANPVRDVAGGYIRALPPRYPKGGNDSEVVLTGTDLLGRLAQQQAKHPYVYEVMRRSPRVFLRLGESEGTIARDESGNGYHGVYPPGITYSVTPEYEDGGIREAGNRAVSFPEVAGQQPIHIPGAGFTDLSTFSVMVVFRTSRSGVFMHLANQFADWLFEINSTGTIDWESPGGILTSGISVVTGTWTTVLGTYNSAASNRRRLWINGSLEGEATGGSPALTVSSSDVYLSARPPAPEIFVGDIDEFIMFPGVELDAAAAFDVYNRQGALENMYPYEMVAEMLDQAGIPDTSDFRSLWQSHFPMGPQDDIGGQSLASVIRRAEITEEGMIFTDNAGRLVFYSREAWHGSTAVGGTTDASNVQTTLGFGAGEIPYHAITLDYSEDGIVTEVRVDRHGGASVSVRDPAAGAKYGDRSFSDDNFATFGRTDYSGFTAERSADQNAVYHAEYLLNLLKDLKLQVRSVTIRLGGDDTKNDAVIARKIGDRVRLRWTPPGGGTMIDREMLIVGRSRSRQPAGPDEITFDLSAQEVATHVALWDDASYGQWDQEAWAW